jgi:hypothetical protein
MGKIPEFMNATAVVPIGHQMSKRGSIYCSHKITNWPIRWLSGLVVIFETNFDKQFTNVKDSYYFHTLLMSPTYFAIFSTQSHIILHDSKHNTQKFPQALRRALPPSSLITLDEDSSYYYSKASI